MGQDATGSLDNLLQPAESLGPTNSRWQQTEWHSSKTSASLNYPGAECQRAKHPRGDSNDWSAGRDALVAGSSSNGHDLRHPETPLAPASSEDRGTRPSSQCPPKARQSRRTKSKGKSSLATVHEGMPVGTPVRVLRRPVSSAEDARASVSATSQTPPEVLSTKDGSAEK